MRPISRRSILTGVVGGVALASRSPAIAVPASSGVAAQPLILNDASRLNPVAVARHAIVRDDHDARQIEELRALLRDAAREGRAFCAAGARHSMGGQSLPRAGIAATMAAPSCVLDANSRSYRARAGTRWRDVIRTLDPAGFSVAVMQSNHDFSVGGTLCVNAHGWPVPFGPFGTTVKALRLMLADGSVVTCSRTENADLLGLAIGGYGLFGIVLDADIEMVDNVLLVPAYELMSASAAVRRFNQVAKEPSVRMAYGRLSVAREGFLKDGFIVSFRPTAAQPTRPPAAQRSEAYIFLSRAVFRRQIGSERGKRLRWTAETVLLPRLGMRPITRNTILSYPVAALADGDARRTDILHEYFIPPERFEGFLAACREIIPAAKQDLLNITLRYVEADPVSVLAYAPAARIAAVLLFTQAVTADADLAMAAMTERLIDAALALGGSFYLPYRPHARPEQLRAAYPRLDEFLAAKRRYDPQRCFRNLMWDKYFA